MALGALTLFLGDRSRATAASEIPTASDHQDTFVSIERIWEEYAEAVRTWPFALPDGQALPAHSGLRDEPDIPARWERGCGAAEAYLVWSTLTASAAHSAFAGGDTVTANRYLDSLISAYDSDIRRAVLEDPEQLFLRDIVLPARHDGAYGPITQFFDLK